MSVNFAIFSLLLYFYIRSGDAKSSNLVLQKVVGLAEILVDVGQNLAEPIAKYLEPAMRLVATLARTTVHCKLQLLSTPINIFCAHAAGAGGSAVTDRILRRG
jgi:hypothetical protein